MTAKVIGLSPKAFIDRLSSKKKPKREDESFGTKSTTLFAKVRTSIEGLSNDELSELLVYLHIRRGLGDRFLKDLGKKVQERKKAIKLENERRQKKTQEIIAYQKTPYYRFKLLANQNPSTRLTALQEWSLTDLNAIYKQIVTEGKLENVLPHMFKLAKQDLLSVIEQKTMSGE